MTPNDEPISENQEADQALLAQRLREAREYLGLSQETVADALAIPRPAISSIENGKRKVSGIELKQLASLYKRPVNFFLGIEDDEGGQDDLMRALYRATRPLSDTDRDQVLRFASFLRNAGKPPMPLDDED